MDPTTGIVIGTVGAQLLTLFTLMFNAHKARRRAEVLRKEELEDRVSARAIELEDRRVLALKVEENTTKIQLAIAENTVETRHVGEKADAAYKEANHVNNKISDLNERLLQLRRVGSDRPN